MSESCHPQVLRMLTHPGDFPLPALVVAPIPPAAPTLNMPWLESTSGKSFLWHANAQWVEFPLSELGEMHPPPRRAVREPPRVRLPSVKRVERESGKRVSILTIAPDGSRTYTFGQQAAAKEVAPAAADPVFVNQWDAIYSETNQKRPS